MTAEGYVKVNLSWNGNTSSAKSNIKILVNGTEIESFTCNWNTATILNYMSDTKYPSWSSVSVTCTVTAWTYYINNTKIYQVTYINSKNFISWIPYKKRDIGEMTSMFIYGNYNGEYKGWIITGTTNEVETGSITLWNAVWFITVMFNGELIKIPYYN